MFVDHQLNYDSALVTWMGVGKNSWRFIYKLGNSAARRHFPRGSCKSLVAGSDSMVAKSIPNICYLAPLLLIYTTKHPSAREAPPILHHEFFTCARAPSNTIAPHRIRARPDDVIFHTYRAKFVNFLLED